MKADRLWAWVLWAKHISPLGCNPILFSTSHIWRSIIAGVETLLEVAQNGTELLNSESGTRQEIKKFYQGFTSSNQVDHTDKG